MSAGCDSTAESAPRAHGPLWNGLLVLERGIMIACGLLVAISISISAALRYIFHMDLYGLEEIVVIFAYWLYFSGAAYGAYEDSHIAAGIVDVYVRNPRIRTGIKLIASLATTGLALLFTLWAWQMFRWTLANHGSTPVWRISLAVPQGAILFGMGLMSFYFCVHLIARFREARASFRADPGADRPA